MSHNVFISHKTEDKDVAKAICQKLEDNGINCWLAVRDQEIGKEYLPQIEHAITNSHLTVFILSRYANEEPKFVATELTTAFEEGLEIIVFRIDEVKPSKHFSIIIRNKQWLDAYPEVTPKHLENLTKSVRRRLYERNLTTAGYLYSKKQWLQCLKECTAIFEKAMRELLRDLLIWSKDKKKREIRKRIITAQNKIGREKSTFETFGLPMLVKLYMRADIFERIRIQLTSSLSNIHKINWTQLVECGKAARRQTSKSSVDKADAKQMLDCLKILLYDCELAGNPTVVETEDEHILVECASCTQSLEEDWNFCPRCGIFVKLACKQCSRQQQSAWNICPYCGKKRALQPNSSRPRDIQKDREEYRILCKGLYADEVINVRERKIIEIKRLELGLSVNEAEKIELSCAKPKNWKYVQLVRRVLIDGVIDDDERIILDAKAHQWNIDPWVKEQIEEAETVIRHGALNHLVPNNQEDIRMQAKNGKKRTTNKRAVRKHKKVIKKTDRKIVTTKIVRRQKK